MIPSTGPTPQRARRLCDRLSYVTSLAAQERPLLPLWGAMSCSTGGRPEQSQASPALLAAALDSLTPGAVKGYTPRGRCPGPRRRSRTRCGLRSALCRVGRALFSQFNYLVYTLVEVGIVEVSGVAQRGGVHHVACGAIEEGVEELAVHIVVVTTGGRLAIGGSGEHAGTVEIFIGWPTAMDRAADWVACAEQVPPWPAAATSAQGWNVLQPELSNLPEDFSAEVCGEESAVKPLQGTCTARILGWVVDLRCRRQAGHGDGWLSGCCSRSSTC